ncbi:hypothetical protein SS05631_a44460 (plasmid) [Sinorhizobium sp. CCBAU 05631]|nr:hypothetical protein SS05631_a44460 [Sinorhizobium sp. CCBAU 05631]
MFLFNAGSPAQVFTQTSFTDPLHCGRFHACAASHEGTIGLPLRR